MRSRTFIGIKSFVPLNMCARLPQGTSMSEPTPRISATALADLFRDHRASNEWNAAVVFYLSGYDALAASCAQAAKDAVQFQDERDALAARVAESDATASALRSCLADLHAVQNGPPLPSYEGAWRRAMDEAERLLGYAGADGGKHGS